MQSGDPNEAHAGAELGGRVALVTGAARGIGRNIARLLARAGASVVIADIDTENGPLAAAELSACGTPTSYLFADLAKVGGPALAIRRCVEQHGRLDILVNNARSGSRADLLTQDEKSWDATMAVTLRGTFFAAQAAIRFWESTGAGGGSIVNIASIAGVLATHEAPAYHAAKAGVIQITRYLAVAGRPFGVRVNAVAPGFVVQDEHRERFDRADNESYRRVANATHPVGRVGTSDDIAEAVLFLATPRSAFMTGQVLLADGGSSVQEQWSFLWQNLQQLP